MTHQPDPAAFAAALPAPATVTVDAAGRQLRHDGWTPERQRHFLERIANGVTVERACGAVGLTVSSAYALRQRAAGAAFALAWRAATLLARERVADELMTRAMDGVTDTVTRADGSVWTRHRHDNRTALALLARLDRMAESVPADPAAAAAGHAARLVAGDWEAFLQLIERDAGAGAAGLFLARRTGLTGSPQAAPELEPVLALARADTFARTGAGLAAEVETADLDAGDRARWSADQWRRAEAAGLLRLAPPPEPAPAIDETPPLPPLVGVDQAEGAAVWWNERMECHYTDLPPPPGETPDWETGDPATGTYQRMLFDDEQALVDRWAALQPEEEPYDVQEDRARWLAAMQDAIAQAEAEAERAGSPPVTAPWPNNPEPGA